MTIERRALSGTFVGGLAFVMTAVQTLLLVPVLLGAWGAERYGEWLALQALAILITTLDLGHQTYVGNEIAKLYFGDRASLRITLASAIWTAAAIGGVEAFCVVGLWASRHLPLALGLPATAVAYEHIDVALLVSTLVWVLAGSVGGVLVRLLPPAGQFVRFTLWGIFTRLATTISLAAGALAGLRILGVTVVSQVAIFLCALALFRDLRNRFRALRPMHRAPSASVGVRNFTRSLLLTASTTFTQLQQNGLNLLVTGILGAAALPAFATARTLASTFAQATTIVCAPLAPEMVRFHVNREYSKLHATFAANWLVGGGIMQVAIIASLPVLSPLYAVWTRRALSFDRGLFALLALAVALRAFGSPILTYLGSINHLRAVTVINFAQSAVVLATGWIAMPRLGLRAAGVAVLLGELVSSCALPMLFVAVATPRPWRSRLLNNAVLSATPLLITGLAMLLYARHLSPVRVALLAVPALALLCWVQWRQLPTEVRGRIRALTRPLFPVRTEAP